MSLIESTQARWNRAARAIRKSGVAFHTNYRSCCRSDANCEMHEKYGEGKDWAYQFAGQGHRIKWEDGEVAERLPSVYVYFNTKRAAEVARDQFVAEGFHVIWDGTENRALEIVLNKPEYGTSEN